jgi:hypothetical protein
MIFYSNITLWNLNEIYLSYRDINYDILLKHDVMKSYRNIKLWYLAEIYFVFRIIFGPNKHLDFVLAVEKVCGSVQVQAVRSWATMKTEWRTDIKIKKIRGKELCDTDDGGSSFGRNDRTTLHHTWRNTLEGRRLSSTYIGSPKT